MKNVLKEAINPFISKTTGNEILKIRLQKDQVIEKLKRKLL